VHDDSVVTAAIAQLLAQAVTPVAPAPATAAAIRKRVLARARAGSHLQRAGEGHWRDLFPGVRVRRLYTDGCAETLLLDCDAGSIVRGHQHSGDEEIYVVRGRIRFDDGPTLVAGDFMQSRAASEHRDALAIEPTLLLLRTAQPLHTYRML
jgi:anti-sigma factor ChrR (cupin superfamily)